MTTEVGPRRTGWATVALLRGAIGVVAGTIALFRPDEAAAVLGAALVAVSLLELAVRVTTGDPAADARRRRRRMLRVGAGVLAGVALLASSIGGAVGETRAVAMALLILAAADAWGAWHATVPGARGLRVARAVIAVAVALVLLIIPSVAFLIVVFAAAVGWIVVGLIALAGVLWPATVQGPDGRTPSGIAEIAGGWLRGRDIGDARRDEILDAYDYDPADRDKLVRFSVLLVLAAIIASAGLIANSVASIIGAMIIAPLMGPIVGIALGIVTGLPKRTLQSLAVAAVGSIATILVGVAMGAWLATSPDVPSNSEIMGRTSPTIVDLVVALAAGAAGAYAASNSKVADSLPGVAIAISLVPPLDTAGILIATGEPQAAAGAMLLFTTNFVSIVLAASVVFVLTGVVPIGRLVANAQRTQGWMVSFAVAGILLLIPLAIGSQQALAAANDGQLASQAVAGWLAPAPEFVIVEVTVTGNAVDVAVAGPGSPPDPLALQATLDSAFGEPVQLDLVVTPTMVYTTPAGASPSPAP
jgi:uncharacterized hydrophobic protein (TIGR00271 family)